MTGETPGVVTRCRSCRALKDTREGRTVPHDVYEHGAWLPCTGSGCAPLIVSVTVVRPRGTMKEAL